MSNPLHVTECFQAVGAVNYDYCTEHARERGSLVHRVCELDDKGTLDESPDGIKDWPDYIAGHLESWRKAKRDLKWETLHIEARMTVGNLTGQADRIVRYLGGLAIIEVKSGAVDPVVSLQMAGYGDMYAPGELLSRIVVQTQASGVPIIHGESVYPLMSYRSDVATFRAMARAAQWNIAHGRYVQQR